MAQIKTGYDVAKMLDVDVEGVKGRFIKSSVSESGTAWITIMEQIEILCDRTVYKATTCGAWLKFTNSGVIVGSIVEGVDFDATPIELKFPFEALDFWQSLQAIEDECKVIWNETHGCEQCEKDGFKGETGYTAINPDCPECKGKGIVL